MSERQARHGPRRSWPELYAKELLGTILEPRGQVITEYEIVARKLRADMIFVPKLALRGRDDLGLIERMIEMGPCMIELFSTTPRARLGCECLGKQQIYHGERCNVARRKHKAMPPRPHLWIISPGRPRSLIKTLGMQPMDGWPAGFWSMAGELHVHLIVIRELPETPATLLLRLLGKGKRLQRALAELDALPQRSRIRRDLVELMLVWQKKASDNPREEAMMFPESKALYAEWKKEVLDKAREAGIQEGKKAGIQEGKKAGIQEGMKAGVQKGMKAGVQKGKQQTLRRLLRKQLTLRFGELPADAKRRIQRASPAKLERWAERVLTAQDLAAVFAD